MPKGIVISNPIYPKCVFVYKGDSCVEALKFFKKSLQPQVWEQNKSKLEREVIGDYMGGVLGISSGDVVMHLKESAGFSIAVHEAFHALELYCIQLGIEFGEYPNEAWAYLLEFFVKQILDNLYND